jgi:integrase
VALALGTGMRQGELLGLRLSDVDLAKGRLHVRQSMSKDAEGRSVIGPPKTDRSRRSIALPASLVDLLAGYLARRPAIRSELLLVNSRARPFTLEGFKSSWRKARQRAVDIMVADAEALGDPHADSAGDGLRSSRFHDLRHTHASEMLRAGINPKVIAERLGDSEMTVLRTYAHVLPDMQEGAAEAADALLAGLLT